MLIDMHAHTSGISLCCQADAETVLKTAREHGMDGLILCNHYQHHYVKDGNSSAFAHAYVEEYAHARKIADNLGIRLFFGAEVTARRHDNAHILLYGLQPDFMLRHPEIYENTLEEMQAMVHAENGLLIHAHPFRNGSHPLPAEYLDGYEVNCHPLYDGTHCEELMQLSHQTGRLITCGGDYHADTYRSVCGVHFPDSVRDGAALVEYLALTDRITLHVHELHQEAHADVVFDKAI